MGSIAPMNVANKKEELIKRAKRSKSKSQYRVIALVKVLPENYELFQKRWPDLVEPSKYVSGWTQAVKSMSSSTFDYYGTTNTWHGTTTVATITYDKDTWEIVRTQGEWVE